MILILQHTHGKRNKSILKLFTLIRFGKPQEVILGKKFQLKKTKLSINFLTVHYLKLDHNKSSSLIKVVNRQIIQHKLGPFVLNFFYGIAIKRREKMKKKTELKLELFCLLLNQENAQHARMITFVSRGLFVKSVSSIKLIYYLS